MGCIILLLFLGGYISGTSLTGAPLIVAVYMCHIVKEQLRNTLFVLWIFLVAIKMSAFIVVGVYIDWRFALMLIPAAAIGHYVGLKAHDKIMENNDRFKRWIGGVLLVSLCYWLYKAFDYLILTSESLFNQTKRYFGGMFNFFNSEM